MAAQLEVFGFIHHTHPAATELREDAIVRDGFADHVIIFRWARGGEAHRRSSGERSRGSAPTALLKHPLA